MLVKRHLNPDGVMIVNMNMRGTEEDSINAYLSDTIAHVFPEVYVADVPGSTNRELFASCNADMMDVFAENVKRQGTDDLTEMMQSVSKELKSYQAGECLLTDDKAPVELLGMRVIDSIIKEEVNYYKKIYKKKGVQGLLEVM